MAKQKTNSRDKILKGVISGVTVIGVLGGAGYWIGTYSEDLKCKIEHLKIESEYQIKIEDEISKRKSCEDENRKNEARKLEELIQEYSKYVNKNK